jgi:integrase
MQKEITIPISSELAYVIYEQQKYIKNHLSTSYQFLFCARRNSVVQKGVKGFVKNQFIPSERPVNSKTFSDVLNGLAEEKKICDSSGKTWHFHPHQFRHTVGTRMINAGVPQHIIQRYLGHESPTMTSVYAHIHDETLRKEIEKFHEFTVVNFQGQLS